jgi:hypothetical protein
MEFPEAAAEQLLPGQTVQFVRTGDTYRPSLYKSRSPDHALSARLARMPCWPNSLAFCLIESDFLHTVLFTRMEDRAVCYLYISIFIVIVCFANHGASDVQNLCIVCGEIRQPFDAKMRQLF